MNNSLIGRLLSGLPPFVQAMITALLPGDARMQIDAMLYDLVCDLANQRDIQACSKIRRVLTEAGVNLADYANLQPENLPE